MHRCTDIPQTAVRNPKDGIVAGFASANPGKLWKNMTGHLQKLQSPISKSYFDNIEYVKVPAFWSGILNPHQLQHALASVSEKWVNRNWSSADARDFPPELNQQFDTSLLNPPELIPEGSGSSMFKDNLMWDPQYQSWRLMFAMAPQSKNTTPTFYHVTWKANGRL